VMILFATITGSRMKGILHAQLQSEFGLFQAGTVQ